MLPKSCVRPATSYSDQEVKQYLTEPTVFSGLFKLAETLYGIRIRPATANVWHSDVKYFEVCRDDEVIASFYADLYAREGKRSGAWMDADRTRCVMDGVLQTPVAYLVCNFAQGVNGRPATLTHDDVTTLFHEFGHCLHHLLTDQTEVAVSGISGVEWDAVELPSQFMENFAWEWDVVKGLAKHVETGESIPESLFEKMLAAKNFQSGMACVRQVEFALFDMLLHTSFNPDTDDVQDLLQDVRREVAVSFPPDYNRFPQSFSHIFAGGYAAGTTATSGPKSSPPTRSPPLRRRACSIPRPAHASEGKSSDAAPAAMRWKTSSPSVAAVRKSTPCCATAA